MGSALEKQKGGDVPGPGAYAYKMDKYINLAFSMGSRHEDIKNVNVDNALFSPSHRDNTTFRV